MICVDIVTDVIHVGVSPITLYALHVMYLLIMYIHVIYIQVIYFGVHIAKTFLLIMYIHYFTYNVYTLYFFHL